MQPYPIKNRYRARFDEIIAAGRKTYGVELVTGFEELVGGKNTRESAERVAGFLEGVSRAWYVPLGTNGDLTWLTKPAPDTIEAPNVLFVFGMGLGMGSPLPQASGQFDLYLNDRRILGFRVVKHSQTWRGDGCALHFSAHRIESSPAGMSMTLDDVLTQESSAAFGMALLMVPKAWVAPGRPATIRVCARSETGSNKWFQLENTKSCIDRADLDRGLKEMFGPRAESCGCRVFYGDIHTHCGVSTHEPSGCGMGSREDSYEYARGPGGLDIYSLTDHERQILAAGVSDYMKLADSYEEEGSFVCLPGYEFTSRFYGHRNVYFPDSNAPVIPSERSWNFKNRDPERSVSPQELWAALDAGGIRAITVPHHPSASSHPFNWDFYNPRYDRLVEIYSAWGSSDFYGDRPRGVSDRYPGLYVREALARGLRFGLIASSDGHDGHPGNAQSPVVKHHHLFHYCGSGWIAVLADKLTRSDVFDAMHARRVYATTGVPIVLEFTVDDAIMGSELPRVPSNHSPTVKLSCTGANALDHVRIIKNGHIALTVPCHGEWECKIEWKDQAPRRDGPDFYYARVVQVDGESAWSSPVWIG